MKMYICCRVYEYVSELNYPKLTSAAYIVTLLITLVLSAMYVSERKHLKTLYGNTIFHPERRAKCLPCIVSIIEVIRKV